MQFVTLSATFTQLALTISFTLTAALGACSSAPPPAPKEPEQKACEALPPKLELSASARVNGTSAGEGRPVQVRLYQLRHDAILLNSTFEEVWQQDREVLADDLLNVVELTVYPDKSQMVDLEPAEGANKLGVVALFREPQGKDWFVTYELDSTPPPPPCPKKNPVIKVYLDRMQIQDGEGRDPDS